MDGKQFADRYWSADRTLSSSVGRKCLPDSSSRPRTLYPNYINHERAEQWNVEAGKNEDNLSSWMLLYKATKECSSKMKE